MAEVRVLANSFQAEYGRNNGGTISMVTKGGTSDLHGSGWYAARRRNLTAISFFNDLQGVPRPVYNINIEGFSVGGPIVIPKIYDGSLPAWRPTALAEIRVDMLARRHYWTACGN